jgi:hypothetical protein
MLKNKATRKGRFFDNKASFILQDNTSLSESASVEDFPAADLPVYPKSPEKSPRKNSAGSISAKMRTLSKKAVEKVLLGLTLSSRVTRLDEFSTIKCLFTLEFF